MLISILASILLSSSPVQACDRAMTDPLLIAAMADQILVGQVTKANSSKDADTIEVKVFQHLKGKTDSTVLISGVFTESKSRFEPCQATLVQTGFTYTFFLFEKSKSEPFYRTVDRHDAVLSDKDPKAQTELLQDTGSHSNWVSTSNGLSVRLVSKKSTYKKDEDIDLDLVFRNETEKKLDFKYRTWPTKAHTFCDLKISSNEKSIRPETVPIPQKEITDYFSKHGNKFDLTLAPYETFNLHLDRINSAKPGWGHKERTGFKFYPLPPGEYKIAAHCPNFQSKPIQTEEIKITVE